MIMLAIDPSFRNLGWTLWDSGVGKPTLVKFGNFRNEATEDKKKTINDFECAKKLAVLLETLLNNEYPDLVIFEMPSGSQNARAAKLLGMTAGVIAAVSSQRHAGFCMVTPMDVKKEFGKKHSKKDIMGWAKEEYPQFIDFKMPAKDFEHIADSIVVMKCYWKKTGRVW